MDSPCYTYAQNKDSSSVLKEAGSMDLVAALHELSLLGKLDSYPRSLNARERRRQYHPPMSAPFCVVQMNSKFVTNFSVSKNSNSDCNSNEDEDNKKSSIGCSPEIFPKPVVFHKTEFSICKRRARIHDYKPYNILLKHPLRVKATVNDIPAATAADRDSPPTVSRQDSGNKSNPNSPVKSQSYPASSGSSIVRSRSLDDLEISKLDLKEDCCYDGYDIDTVSQCISKLHVS